MGAFENSLDACQHGVERERLGDVVVSATLESGQLVVVMVAGGEEYDGGVVAFGSEVVGHLKSRHTVHHHVQQYEVEVSFGMRCQQLQRIFGTIGSIHFKTFIA